MKTWALMTLTLSLLTHPVIKRCQVSVAFLQRYHYLHNTFDEKKYLSLIYFTSCLSVLGPKRQKVFF